jgi:hypothetical protein
MDKILEGARTGFKVDLLSSSRFCYGCQNLFSVGPRYVSSSFLHFLVFEGPKSWKLTCRGLDIALCEADTNRS